LILRFLSLLRKYAKFFLSAFLLALPLLLITKPAQASLLDSSYSIPNLEDYFYTTVVRFFEQNDREGLLNVINLDSLRARKILIRLLREENQEWAHQFALLFPLSCESELEMPFIDFYLTIDPGLRDELLDLIETITDAEFAMNRLTSNDRFNREAWSRALADLEKGAELFRSTGFELGQAYCLSCLGLAYSYDTRPFEARISALEKALSIFEKLGDLRGQARCLIRFARGYYMKGNDQKFEEYRNLALDKAKANGDMVLYAYLSFYGKFQSGEQRKEIAANALSLIEKNKGLRAFKNYLLAELGEFDKLRELLAKEQDTILKIRGYWTLSDYVRNMQERFEALSQAITLSQSLPCEIWPFEELGAPFPPLPSIFQQRAYLKKESGNLKEAEDDYIRALTILEDLSCQADSIYIKRLKGDLHRNLCGFFRSLGDYPLAIVEAEKALEIFEKMENHWQTIWACQALAEVYSDLGDLAQAEHYLREASEQPDPFFNPSDIFLAQLHLSFERYEEALKDLNRAEEAFRREGPGAKRLSGTWMRICKHLLAAVWLHLGEPAKALEVAQDAERIHKMMLAMEAYEHVTPTGLVLAEMKRYSEAEEYFKKRLSLARESSYRLAEAGALKNLGKIYRTQGRQDQAIEHLLQALELFKLLGYPRRALEVFLELGQISLEKKDFSAATNYFQEALRLAGELEQPKGIWSANYGLGQIAIIEKDENRAIIYLKAAVEAVESVAGRIKVELHKSSFLDDKIAIYDELIRLLGESDAAEAFFYSERRRAQAFLELTQKSGVPLSSEIPGDLLNKKLELESRLIGKQKAILEQFSKPAEKRNDKLISSLREELKTIREEHTQILKYIQLSHPVEASREGILTPITAKRVQEEILKQGQVLVEYVDTGHDVFAFVVDKTSCRFFVLPVERMRLTQQIEELHFPFRQFRQGRVDLLHLDFDIRLAYQIYKEVFQPLEAAIKGANQVFIVPDNVLFYLPFESLARSDTVGESTPGLKYGEYQSVDWLVRHYTISLALSATSLHPQLRASRGVPGKLVAFGDPAIGVFAKSKLGQTFLRAFEPETSHPSLHPLPQSAKEASLVARLMGAKVLPKILIGEEANENAFVKEGPLAGYLHFAVHSLLNEQQPYYSGLVLSPEKDTDGLLQSFEIFNSRLNCRLVTLSSCETALGKLLKGEGIISLARAFLLAGSKSIVVSLWSIEDSTIDFMGAFYENLSKNQPLPVALRNAKLHCLEKTVTIGSSYKLSLSHPFFWAPFVLTSTSIE